MRPPTAPILTPPVRAIRLPTPRRQSEACDSEPAGALSCTMQTANPRGVRSTQVGWTCGDLILLACGACLSARRPNEAADRPGKADIRGWIDVDSVSPVIVVNPGCWVCIAGNGDFSSGESSDGSVQSPEKPPAGASDRRRGGDGGLNSGGRGSPRHSTELQSGQYQSGNETSTSTVMSGQSGRGQDPTWLSYKSLLGIRTKGRKRSDTHRSNSSKGRQQRRFMFRSTDPDVDGGEGGSDSDNSERGGYSSSLGALTPRALPTDWRRTFHSAVRASYHYVRGDRLAAPVRQVMIRS
jgi:hypothetical protein